MLPIFNPSFIQDHNAEGFDSVDSEDFEAGFGSVPILQPVTLKEPPPVVSTWTENDWENYYYSKKREQEITAEEDLFLNNYNL